MTSPSRTQPRVPTLASSPARRGLVPALRNGAVSIVVTLLLAACGGDSGSPSGPPPPPPPPPPRVATTIVKIAGDSQQGPIDSTLAADLEVEVRDQDGAAMTGVIVTWSVLSGSGTLTATQTTTDSGGRTSTRWTLGPTAGTQEVRASAGSAATVFGATATLPDMAPTQDTQVEGVIEVGALMIPENVTLTLTGATQLSVSGDAVVDGTILGECVPFSLSGSGSLAVTGTIDNACADEELTTQPHLTLRVGGPISLDGAMVAASGDVTITNLPPAELQAALGRAAVATSGRSGLVDDPCELRISTVSVGGVAPSGGNGIPRGADGENAAELIVGCSGAVRLGGTVLAAVQAGGSGGFGRSQTSGVEAVGGNGGNGASVFVLGQTIEFSDAAGGSLVTLRSGGTGGGAWAEELEEALARGGDGGNWAPFTVSATEEIRFVGDAPLTIRYEQYIDPEHLPNGNSGGHGLAEGEPGAPATSTTEAGRGGSAVAQGGKGGSLQASDGGVIRLVGDIFQGPSISGTLDRVVVEVAAGGGGGSALPRAGTGGDGSREFPGGGPGGWAQGTGGPGGDVKLLDTRSDVFPGRGGPGGHVQFNGSNGGLGFDACLPARLGGTGGRGGDLSSQVGPGGFRGLEPSGSEGGTHVFESANGGEGGDGSHPGPGGLPGALVFFDGPPPVVDGSSFQRGPDGDFCPGVMVASDDFYPVRGNVGIDSSVDGLRVTDNDEVPADAMVTAFELFTANSGELAIQPDGSFTFTPAPGWTGVAEATYTLSDGVNSVDAVVRLEIVDPIWFIDPAAEVDGDGRLNTPFNRVTSFNQFANDGSGDVIFLHQGVAACFPELLENQAFIGQDVRTPGVWPPQGMPPSSPLLPPPLPDDPTLTTIDASQCDCGACRLDIPTGVTVAGFTVRNAPHAALWIEDAMDFVVQDVAVEDSGDAGLWVGGTSSGDVLNTSFRRSVTNNIDVTDLTGWVRIERVVSEDAGDDLLYWTQTTDGGRIDVSESSFSDTDGTDSNAFTIIPCRGEAELNIRQVDVGRSSTAGGSISGLSLETLDFIPGAGPCGPSHLVVNADELVVDVDPNNGDGQFRALAGEGQELGLSITRSTFRGAQNAVSVVAGALPGGEVTSVITDNLFENGAGDGLVIGSAEFGANRSLVRGNTFRNFGRSAIMVQNIGTTDPGEIHVALHGNHVESHSQVAPAAGITAISGVGPWNTCLALGPDNEFFSTPLSSFDFRFDGSFHPGGMTVQSPLTGLLTSAFVDQNLGGATSEIDGEIPLTAGVPCATPGG